MKAKLAAVLVLFLASVSFCGDLAITIYNDDLGLVRETREFDFPKGAGEVRFTDVAEQIIPTSVSFNSPIASLLEQNYEYDLVDARKLMEKYIDRSVELYTEGDGFFRGTLLAAKGDVVIKEDDGSIRSIAGEKIFNVHFPDLPEGLITRPTLVWLVNSSKSGKNDAEISYLTNGISWIAEYVAVTDKNDESLNLTGWVNIDNNSGATYSDARIKLMAGDVQIIKDKRHYRDRAAMRMTMAMEEGAGGFEEQPFYEYHLYTLQRQSTLRNNQVKQISLFPTAFVKDVKKEYRFAWNQWREKVKVFLSFENEDANNLGIPLPKGKVRVSKEGPDGGLEFIGEDKIDHTPKNEEVKISTGFAFDVVGERSELDRQQKGRGVHESTIEIKLRNHKKETVEVIVEENLWGDWEILSGTPGWEKASAQQVEWTVKVKPEEEKVVRYTVLVK